MKLCRFGHDRIGVVDGDAVADVSAALELLPPLRWPVPKGDHLIANLARLLPRLRELAADAPRVPLSSVRLLSPIANPAHVIAAPLNYPLHVEEAKSQDINFGVHLPHHEGYATPIDKFGLFLKSQTGVVGPAEGVEIHFPDRRTDHEIELAVVIGRPGKRIAPDAAMGHVAGYCIGLDITVRGPEDRSYRKSADSYAVLGPWLVTADEVPDPLGLDMSLRVDNELRQSANTRSMIVPIPDLISRASRVFALYPGDVILTGTPDGVGPLRPGVVIHAAIAAIGAMDVAVR